MNTYGALWPSFVPKDRDGLPEYCAVSAAGKRVRFADGRELLCATSGLWNANLGYGNSAIAQAIYEAASSASYLGTFRVSNAYAEEAAQDLTDLAARPEFGRVVFSTSGGAANDLAMKVARQHFAMRGSLRRTIVSLNNSYHGLTFGSFALTGQPLQQELYGVDQRSVRHVPPNSIEALQSLFRNQGEQIAAIVVEPVLGTGTVPLETAWLDALFELRDEFGFLIVADEVATGFGRTGPMLATSEWTQSPDMIILSKGLTNGTCGASAVLISHEVAGGFHNSGLGVVHGETQAGTAISCAAIGATLREFDRLGAIANAERVAQRLHVGLANLRENLDLGTSVRGKGLFLTLKVEDDDGREIGSEDVAGIVDAIRSFGVIVYPGLSGIQIVPALTYQESEVDELCSAIEDGMRSWISSRTRHPVGVQ